MSTPSLSINANWLTRSRVGVAVLLVIAYGVIPFTGSEYLLDAILTPFLALALAAVGLNVLTGYAGQVSLGSAAFRSSLAYQHRKCRWLCLRAIFKQTQLQRHD